MQDNLLYSVGIYLPLKKYPCCSVTSFQQSYYVQKHVWNSYICTLVMFSINCSLLSKLSLKFSLECRIYKSTDQCYFADTPYYRWCCGDV